MGIGIYIFLIGLGAFLLAGIKIVRPTHNLLIETLGKYSRTATQGFNWIIPVIQRGTYVNMTEQMTDIEPQVVITSDNLNVGVDAVVYYKVENAKKSVYNIDDHERQLTSLARTTLRAVIGKKSLKDANEQRDKINTDVEKILKVETASYGVDVLRVEIQRIEPPADVQEQMNEVVKAERKKIAAKDFATAVETEADGRRRANIKEAEGRRQASILIAEGKSKAFELIEKTFNKKAQLDKQLEVTRDSLKNNSKIILTQKGISPQLLIGDLPITSSKK